MHHAPWDAVLAHVRKGRKLVGILRVADQIALAIQIARDDTAALEEVPGKLPNLLGLEPSHIVTATSDVEKQVNEMCEIMLLHNEASSVERGQQQ